jgi:hypothetical protein
MSRATGSFDVKIVPQTSPEESSDKALGRMSIDKQFHGDLDATSRGQMLTAMTEVNGAALYVAIEKVSGSLENRTGTFVLYHNGIATREGQQLTVTVAPGSGTGGLKGITGSMSINIIEKKHYYEFDYSLPGVSE